MLIEHSEPDVLCNMTVDHSDLTSEQSLSCMLPLSYEYDVSAHGSNVKGRLKTRTMFWKDIKASPFVLDILENGYSIPFISIPISKFNRNNKSARDNSDFVTEAVSELLEKRCVVEASSRPHVINPLSVAINSSGKKRLILDLHEVNLHVRKSKVKFEDWRVAMHYFHKGDFMFKFDLKSGYHHIDIAEWCQTFLGFAWQERFYVFTVLPFGLSSAPYIFTKCLRPMVRFWREHGVNIVLYLDDGWCSNRSLESCSRDAQFVYDSLKRAGFVVNMEKSILEPTTSLNWLGLIWDSGDHSISIPEKRISDLMVYIDLILSDLNNVSARSLAKVTGRIISMSPVIGNVTRIKSRYLYRCIESRFVWDYWFRLTDQQVIDELQFWRAHVRSLNLKLLSEYKIPTVVVYSDASSFACGALSAQVDQGVFHRMWTSVEASRSSTWRELKAIELYLITYKGQLSGKVVKCFTDSKNCESIVLKGSTIVDLQDLACSIFSICALNSISLLVQWLPRDQNTAADAVSKFFDYDDWGVSYEFFAYVDFCLGPIL